VVLGQAMPAMFHWLGTLEVAKVNIPVGLLIWVMICWRAFKTTQSCALNFTQAL